jgi:ABC-type transport system involved in cytochrome c biogenesis permease subunit
MSDGFIEHPIKTVDISAKMLYAVSRHLPLVKGAEKMKRLALLLKRGGVLNALSAFAALTANLLLTPAPSPR